MSLTKQKIHGKIKITAGVNDVVFWEENAGAGDVNKSITIAADSYYPEALAASIATQMTASSGAITYTASQNNSTGQLSFTASTGGYFFEVNTTKVAKLLTGGDVSLGNKGSEHLGFIVDTNPGIKGVIELAPFAPAFSWYPDQPKATDDEGNSKSSSIQAVSMGGDVVSYDFSGASDYLKTRSQSFERLNASSRAQFYNFWSYAKTGDPFRYYDDSTGVTFEERVLTGETLAEPSFSRTDAGLPRWSLSFFSRLKK